MLESLQYLGNPGTCIHCGAEIYWCQAHPALYVFRGGSRNIALDPDGELHFDTCLSGKIDKPRKPRVRR